MRIIFPTTRYFTATCLMALGLIPLCAAWFTQYVLAYPPCHLCMLQRYPYAVIAALGFLAIFYARLQKNPRLLWRLAALCLLITGAIACYHVGIEQGWIIEQGGCSSPDIGAVDTLDALRARLMQAPLVACNAVSLRVLGLSMATYNVALGLMGAIVCMRMGRIMGRRSRGQI